MTVLQPATKVDLVVRNTGGSTFSIERVFGSVQAHLPRDIDARWVELPCQSLSPPSILRNLWFVSKLSADVVHITGDTYYCALAVPRERLLLTIHDIVSVHRLRGLKRWVFETFWYRLPLPWSPRVTCVSESSLKEIKSYAMPRKGPRNTVHNPCLSSGDGSRRDEDQSNDKFTLLQVGTNPNKNLERVANAISDLGVRLKIVGLLTREQRDTLSALSIDYESFADLSDEEMNDMYHSSDALVFASLYEGFGLPILEAQVNGCPVITSSKDPMSEIAGDGAILVDPQSTIEIREAVSTIRQSADLREKLTAAGSRNVARFSPTAVATKYAGICRRASASSNG